MERHQVTAGLEIGRGRVLINDHDISAITTGLHIEVGAEGIATVTLELSPDAVKATMISDVVLEPDEAREALISLGWTPPEVQE